MKGLGIFRRRGRRGGSARLPGDIRAGFAQLVITTYTALIEKSNNISSAVSSLVLTTYQATIGRDINVTTGTPVALTVTPLQATITNPSAATDWASNGDWAALDWAA